MKTVLFCLLMCMSFSLTAQQFSSEAKKLQTDHPEVFTSIEEYASSKWKNDSVKIIAEINDQAKAFGDVCKLVIADFSRNLLCLETLKQRTEDGKAMSFTDPSINWAKVLFDLKQRDNVKTAF